MAAANDANGQLLQFLNHLLYQLKSIGVAERFYRFGKKRKVEAESNQPETELRSKIKALGLETTKVPLTSSKQADELEIAKELDRISAKLDSVDELISSSATADPQVQSLLCGTADLWMPVITATADERRAFAASAAANKQQDTFEKQT
eukprot:Gb_08503 [translate_table: standard]